MVSPALVLKYHRDWAKNHIDYGFALVATMYLGTSV